jgi:hypothetical protein
MVRGWPFAIPLSALIWWFLGFPPGWGWLVAPMFPAMPISLGMVVVMAALVAGLAFAIRLALDNA